MPASGSPTADWVRQRNVGPALAAVPQRSGTPPSRRRSQGLRRLVMSFGDRPSQPKPDTVPGLASPMAFGFA